MMIYIFCGIIIGMVMGLTGSGGALVAIPLFMHFMGMTLKDASVYSLLAVVSSSVFNFIAQRKLANIKVATLIYFFSIISSYVVVPLKNDLSPEFIALILICISLYAVYVTWFNSSGSQQKDPKRESKNIIFLSLVMGLMLGALTTITGLGGGVLLMPIFIKIFFFKQDEAVATSLLTVALSSTTSLIIQIQHGFQMNFDLDIIYLIVGIFCSALILKITMMNVSNKSIVIIRKVVFTAVVFLAILKLALN